MPPPAFVSSSAFVKLYWSLVGQLAMNILACRVTGNPTFDQNLANSLGTAIKAAFTSNLAAQCGAQTSLVRVGVRDYRTPGMPEFRDTGATVPGTAVGDNLPPQVSAAITLRTARSGKSFRGRVYLPGFGEAVNAAGGGAATTVATSGIAFLQAVDTALQGNGLKLAVMSRPAERVTIVKTTFHADGTTTVQTLSNIQAKSGGVEAVTAFESRNASWETQRRRGNGRGVAPSSLDPVASGAAP